MNPYHEEILAQIKKHSGKATQHTFLDSYLGNSHPRYPISAPKLRKIAKEWMQVHRDLSHKEFSQLLTSLIEGVSSTEKCMAGVLLDYSTPAQRQFDPAFFDSWLDHLVGWAEVDSVCTGKYTTTALTENWKKWKPLLSKFCKSQNIHKRRASLVLLCSAVRNDDDERLAEIALANVDKLKSKKEILITKAISWLLRSLIKHHRKSVAAYLKQHAGSLPAIAVRETRQKLVTGKKTTKRTVS